MHQEPCNQNISDLVQSEPKRNTTLFHENFGFGLVGLLTCSLVITKNGLEQLKKTYLPVRVRQQ